MRSIKQHILARFASVVVIAFVLLMTWLVFDLEPRYRESIEEQLVDTSVVLSSLVAISSPDGELKLDSLQQTFFEANARTFSAQIFQVIKTSIDLHVFVTDSQGKLLYDSTAKSTVGSDFSQWRDVALALRGEYGARTTFLVPGTRESMTLYVASPIFLRGKLKGVLSIGKPLRGVTKFIWDARLRVMLISIALLLILLYAVYVAARRISQPVQLLIAHTAAIRGGRGAALPQFEIEELASLGKAIEEMRQKIAGQEYVEKMLEAFSHEMKSPVAAIRSAAEILTEKPPEEVQRRFTQSIIEQTERIKVSLSKLLELSRLENANLPNNESIPVSPLLREVVSLFEALAVSKNIRFTAEDCGELRARGDRSLLMTALSNLVQNAIDFTPKGGEVSLAASFDGEMVSITVSDTGTGIPGYAFDRIFDRFYSLERPDTQRKSTGLGLAIVREIALLHGGDVSISNRSSGGCVATLRGRRDLSC